MFLHLNVLPTNIICKITEIIVRGVNGIASCQNLHFVKLRGETTKIVFIYIYNIKQKTKKMNFVTNIKFRWKII